MNRLYRIAGQYPVIAHACVKQECGTSDFTFEFYVLTTATHGSHVLRIKFGSNAGAHVGTLMALVG